MPLTSSNEADSASKVTAGTLYVVGTPIGNLGDITVRALETLRGVDRIAAEDTRRTRALLAHFGIHGKPLDTIEHHTSAGRIQGLLRHLEAGQSVALVTDAGMPALSDPGQNVVAAAREAGHPVCCIPGPSAVTAAVAWSGLVPGPFRFLGFLPRKGEARTEALEGIAGSPEPVVLFESPRRVQETLQDLAKWAPDRALCVCREMTKLHEECVRGTAAELAQRGEWLGEMTLVLGASKLDTEQVTDAELSARVVAELRAGRAAKGISTELAAWSGRPRREVYALVLRLRDG